MNLEELSQNDDWGWSKREDRKSELDHSQNEASEIDESKENESQPDINQEKEDSSHGWGASESEKEEESECVARNTRNAKKRTHDNLESDVKVSKKTNKRKKVTETQYSTPVKKVSFWIEMRMIFEYRQRKNLGVNQLDLHQNIMTQLRQFKNHHPSTYFQLNQHSHLNQNPPYNPNHPPESSKNLKNSLKPLPNLKNPLKPLQNSQKKVKIPFSPHTEQQLRLQQQKLFQKKKEQGNLALLHSSSLLLPSLP